MAIFSLTDAFVSINGVTLSDHGMEVHLVDNRDQLDATAFGATSKVYQKGLGDATMTVSFFQDFAGGKVHATLQPLIASTTPVTVEARATSAIRSATNPAYVMSALLFEYQMLDGAVGEMSKMTATFQNAAQAGVTYPTA